MRTQMRWALSIGRLSSFRTALSSTCTMKSTTQSILSSASTSLKRPWTHINILMSPLLVGLLNAQNRGATPSCLAFLTADSAWCMAASVFQWKRVPSPERVKCNCTESSFASSLTTWVRSRSKRSLNNSTKGRILCLSLQSQDSPSLRLRRMVALGEQRKFCACMMNQMAPY